MWYRGGTAWYFVFMGDVYRVWPDGLWGHDTADVEVVQGLCAQLTPCFPYEKVEQEIQKHATNL